MKRLFAQIVFLLLLLLITSSGEARMSVGMMAGGVGSVSTPPYCESFLICQNNETTTTGWDNSESWTSSCTGSGAALTVNDTTSPSPLRGSQSLRIKSGAGTLCYATSPAFTAQDTVYTRFRFAPVSFPTSDFQEIFESPAGCIVTVKYISAGVYQIGVTDGTVTGYSANLSDFTSHTYTIWIDYTKGTGSNAVYHLYIAVDSTTKPGSANVTITNGVLTIQATRVYPITAQSSVEYVVDNILVKTSDIGSGD